MFKIKAKIKFKHNSFDIINMESYCTQFQIKKIPLKDLNYWDVDLQEAYFSPKNKIKTF